MAINKEGTGYTYFFSFLMVVVVGSALAFAAESLREPQQENVKQEKMQNILASVGIECTRAEAPALFEQYITERMIVNYEGKVVETATGPIDKKDAADAFNVDVQKDYRKVTAGILTVETRNYPLFKCEKDGQSFYIVPLVGKGLWGPIWGYVSLESDMNTVFGATFDHKTETPGLGAEINTDWFESPFKGKKLFDAKGEFASIRVLKTGNTPDNPHGVDGITGGTITSVGVDKMLTETLSIYVPYFKDNKS